MCDQIELFYLEDDAVPRGAVVTTIGEAEVTCRVHFSTPDGFRGGGASSVRTDGSVTAWTDFTFISDGTTTVGRDGAEVTVAGVSILQQGVVPSYALTAFVLELVQGPDAAVDFHLLDESALLPDGVRAASLRCVGTEEVHSPVRGLLMACERVELTVAGRRTNTYWTRDGVVVASDWAGARSYALPASTADSLRAALDVPLPAAAL